jgi:rhodanese-related sulfurtransferase
MKTITPFELQMLIDKRYVEVIDVRPTNDFRKVHALVARSIPLKKFEPHSVLAHRRGKRGAPIYIFGERKAHASLVAGELAAAGLAEPIVVDGGVEAWAKGFLPVARQGSDRKFGGALLEPLAALLRRTRQFFRGDAAIFKPSTSLRL